MLLVPSGTEGAFRTLFLCVHSPVLPLGVAPDPASLGQGDKETSYLKNDCCPPPLRGVRREWDATPRSLWQKAHPLSAPAQRRSGSTGGCAPLIPAGGINRHTQAVVLYRSLQPSFSGCVGSRHRSNAHRWQGLTPYCARTDLVPTKKETDICRLWFASWKRLCCKGFRSDYPRAPGRFSWRSGGNRRLCQGANCAHPNYL